MDGHASQSAESFAGWYSRTSPPSIFQWDTYEGTISEFSTGDVKEDDFKHQIAVLQYQVDAEIDAWLKRSMADSEHRFASDNYRKITEARKQLCGLYIWYWYFEQAESHVIRLLQESLLLYGAEDTETLNVMAKLGIVLTGLARFTEAELTFKTMINTYLEPGHLSVLRAQHSLAVLYENTNRPQDAEPLLQKVLAIQKELVGSKHEAILRTEASLAKLHVPRQRYSNTELKYICVLGEYENLICEEDLATLWALDQVCNFYFRRGRLKDAKPFLERALNLNERLQGTDALQTCRTASMLGDIFFFGDDHDYAAAKSMYSRALKGFEKIPGPCDKICKLLERLSEINNVLNQAKPPRSKSAHSKSSQPKSSQPRSPLGTRKVTGRALPSKGKSLSGLTATSDSRRKDSSPVAKESINSTIMPKTLMTSPIGLKAVDSTEIEFINSSMESSFLDEDWEELAPLFCGACCHESMNQLEQK